MAMQKNWQEDSRVITGEKCRAFVQHVASGSTHVPAIDVIHRSVHKKSEVADVQLAEGA